MKIPIASPLLGSEEQKAVQDVLSSNNIAHGAVVEAFEKQFASFIGTEYGIATNNGTTALHTALVAHGIGPGDEIITTPFSFIATGNCIRYVGASPVFVDIKDDFNINPETDRGSDNRENEGTHNRSSLWSPVRHGRDHGNR